MKIKKSKEIADEILNIMKGKDFTPELLEQLVETALSNAFEAFSDFESFEDFDNAGYGDRGFIY